MASSDEVGIEDFVFLLFGLTQLWGPFTDDWLEPFTENEDAEAFKEENDTELVGVKECVVEQVVDVFCEVEGRKLIVV